MEWSNVQLIPQGKCWRCTVTTLEYLTGIPRDDIIRDLGHDGGIRPKSIRDKLKEGGPVFADEDCLRLGVLESETLWWLFKKGINATYLKTKQFLVYELCQEKSHDAIYCPSQDELWESILGKCALLAKELFPEKNIWHHVAWLAGTTFDPATGRTIGIKPQNVFAAIILSDISPSKRLCEIQNDLQSKL